MTRTIPPSLAPVIAELELKAADLVTMAKLNELVKASGGGYAHRGVTATRMRLVTPYRPAGLWEIAPGAVSRDDHTRLLVKYAMPV